MRRNEKIMITVLVAIAIIAVVWWVNRIKKGNGEEEQVGEVNTVKEEFVEVLDDGTKLNTSSKLQETKRFEGMEISNLQLTENNNVTLLLGTITNKTSTKQGGYPVDIKIIDKYGREIITVVAFIGELEAGKSTQLSTSATFDYANAYDFSISRRK